LTVRAGLRRVRFHDLQHTFGSHLIAAGVDLKTVSTLMGHSSISVTVDIYGHMLKDSNRDAVARLEHALGCKTVATANDASRTGSQVLERMMAGTELNRRHKDFQSSPASI
jgi:hypothetical protein